MTQRRTADETRLIIFDACQTILCQDGLPNLTLDKVAEVAGLSKGGLLYHFPTKLALIEALFAHHLDKFDANVEAQFETESELTRGRWLKAYAQSSIEQITDPDTGKVFASLFAAGERYPSVLQIMRDRYDVWQARVAKSRLDPVLSMMIRVAVDGLWFTQMYQFAPPNAEMQAEVVAKLLNLMVQPNG
jgi:AcrR family transcriptional regulator